jgi:hypothetical protein
MRPESVANRLITLHNLAWVAFSIYWSYGVLQDLQDPYFPCTCEEDDTSSYVIAFSYAGLVFLSALSASVAMHSRLRQRGVLAVSSQTVLAILVTIPATLFFLPRSSDDFVSTLLIALTAAIGSLIASTIVWWKYQAGQLE